MRVNGKETSVYDRMTVLELLKSRGHDPLRVAVEVDGMIVPRATFAETVLTADSRVEIAQFVGGG